MAPVPLISRGSSLSFLFVRQWANGEIKSLCNRNLWQSKPLYDLDSTGRWTASLSLRPSRAVEGIRVRLGLRWCCWPSIVFTLEPLDGTLNDVTDVTHFLYDHWWTLTPLGNAFLAMCVCKKVAHRYVSLLQSTHRWFGKFETDLPSQMWEVRTTIPHW